MKKPAAHRRPDAKKSLPCGRPTPQPEGDHRDSVVLLSEMTAKLDEYCRQKNLNRTEARSKVLETIVFEARHFTALDLLSRLQRRHPEVGKATLYRNLPILVESQIIEEGPTAHDGQKFYELTGEDHHDHIVCLDCQQIFEFHDELIEKRQDRVSGELGFSPRGHRHVIYAACDYLAEGARSGKSGSP